MTNISTFILNDLMKSIILFHK